MGIASGKHGVTLGEGQLGIFFGARSYNMQTPEGQINESYSISAGLDFPSVGPEHAHLKYTGRAEYVSVTDREALGAFLELSLKEGIIPALESSHALAYALKMARAEPPGPRRQGHLPGGREARGRRLPEGRPPQLRRTRSLRRLRCGKRLRNTQRKHC